MTESKFETTNSRRSNKYKRNANIRRGPSKNIGFSRSGILSLIVLAGLLLSCNVLWIYSTEWTHHRACNYESAFWGARASNESTSYLDYQKVQGSGLKNVPVPLDIPNSTVLAGEDIGSQDGEKLRFMTIGISSVERKENYLFRTLDSIIKQTTKEEKLEILIFLLLADADPQVRIRRAKAIENRYKDYLDVGLLRVIQPPPTLYPSINFAKIRRTYGDPVERVQWRTKQVLDFAFLFWYTWARQPSVYYLILEDDVLSAKHFVSAARDFVEMHKEHHWIALQLAGFLGIGQLVRCSDLDRLVSFLLLFYTEHPVDMLFNQWVSLMVPEKPPKNKSTRRVPGLFQHIGVHSTLANKIQRSRDSTFSLIKRRFSHINPDAAIVTTIKQYKSFEPELAYSSAPGMFWGMPKAKDTFDIVFSQSLQLARIFISTGTNIHNKKKTSFTRDKLTSGHVEVSSEFASMNSPQKATCKDFKFLMKFEKGEVDTQDFTGASSDGIQCIRVVIDSQQKTWVAISEIAVFTMDENNFDGFEQNTNEQNIEKEKNNPQTLGNVARISKKNIRAPTLANKNTRSVVGNPKLAKKSRINFGLNLNSSSQFTHKNKSVLLGSNKKSALQ